MTQPCTASSAAEGNVRHGSSMRDLAPDVERQLRSQTDRLSFRQDPAAGLVATDLQDDASMTAAVLLQNDKRGIDSSVHRSPLGLAAKHNRRCMVKAIAWFLRTT